jgi:hypothetical protein
MADANTTVTLDELHDAIRAAVAAAFPSFQTVEFYHDDEDQAFPTPACFMEMTEAETDEANSGTGQWHALLRFEARIVMPNRSAGVRLEIRKAATAFATWLNLRRWGAAAPGDECRVIACEKDEFAPQVDKFAVWRVEWVQLVMLGETAWTNDGVVPTDVLYSFVPLVGDGNEGEYKPLDQVEVAP